MAARSQRQNGNGNGQPESIDYPKFTVTLDPVSIAAVAEAVAGKVAELPNPAEDRWLDSREAADYLALPLSSLRKLSASERLQGEQDTPGGRLYFKRSDLDAWRRGPLR